MSPIKKIKVNNLDISISIESNKDDYFCLTDIIKDKEGEDHIRNWMRNKNTIEFLGTWEILNNPDFKGVEFDTFLNQAGLNRFNMTPKKWIEATNAIGIVSKAGRNGGTYAHKDIALEFCSWFNPTFKLYLLKEYQRLKEFENDPLKVEWKIKRILSKTNYHLQTDAIKSYILPQSNMLKDSQWLIYAKEADLLNAALWGCTACEWRDANPGYASKGLNIRDMASINELVVLSNLESFNSELIKLSIPKQKRFKQLQEMAQKQIQQLNTWETEKKFKQIDNNTNLIE